jgi:hypothetical protein
VEDTNRQSGERGQLVRENFLSPAWLPRGLSRRINPTEFAVIPKSVSRKLEAEADVLGVYLAAYRHDSHAPKKRLQLCTCIKVAEIDRETVRRLNRLQARLGVVLVAYARPLKIRVRSHAPADLHPQTKARSSSRESVLDNTHGISPSSTKSYLNIPTHFVHSL